MLVFSTKQPIVIETDDFKFASVSGTETVVKEIEKELLLVCLTLLDNAKPLVKSVLSFQYTKSFHHCRAPA